MLFVCLVGSSRHYKSRILNLPLETVLEGFDDGETELADKVKSLETELAEARDAIASKDGELEDLNYVPNLTRLKQKVPEHNMKLPKRYGCWSSSWRASV